MSAWSGYTLPAVFALDWLERMDGDPLVPDAQTLVIRPRSPKGTTVVLQLNDEQLKNLLSDAKLYADTSNSYWDESVRLLCQSAKRVVAALQRQGVTA